jgi:hypothetical protein
LPFQEIEGQVVIVVPARREVHQLNEVGTFLWNCLEERRSVAELVELVCGEFEVAQDQAERDVRSFLASLETRGLLGPAQA